MNNMHTTILSYVVTALLLVRVTCEETADKPEEDDTLSTEDLMLLASMIADAPGQLTDIPEGGVNEDRKAFRELFKRQANDGEIEDYGWGGGWFGKRSKNARDLSNVKRYDPFNVGGRFGKRYDPFNVGGRFGKRYDPFNVGGRFGKRYDPFNVGGRFGKRYDPFNVGGRFGKRTAPSDDLKRYDMYHVGGRFGKRDGEGKKRYDMYSVGGRFGRDTSQLRHEQSLKTA